MTPEQTRFKEHLEYASKKVLEFPEWKRNILGRSAIDRWIYRKAEEETDKTVVLTYWDFE